MIEFRFSEPIAFAALPTTVFASWAWAAAGTDSTVKSANTLRYFVAISPSLRLQDLDSRLSQPLTTEQPTTAVHGLEYLLRGSLPTMCARSLLFSLQMYSISSSLC